VNIEAHLGEKLTLLRHYDSEMRDWPHPRSYEAIDHRARYWGSVAGFAAAEPFTERSRWT
jgi:N-acetylglucosamine malate deacetylase 1